jgi:hypothetical protein
MQDKTRLQPNGAVPDRRGEKPFLADRKTIAKKIAALSGGEILDLILGHETPKKIVQDMPSGDFFWLVKKVGSDDCIPLLELASEDQWTYLLDLEIWQKDRLDMEHTSLWLNQLQQAQPRALSRWLFDQGQSLAYYYLYKNIQLFINDGDENIDIPDGFFSLDNVFYINVIDPRYRDTIEKMLRELIQVDSLKYQALLLGLAGLLSTEIEEDMYRMRNVRLAEHGFLPYDEAISVYTPLDLDAFNDKTSKGSSGIIIDNNKTAAVVPLLPFYQAHAEDILTIAISEISDPILLDRLRLEFAGLCNQILSADGILNQEIGILIKTCRKTAGYINLALERISGKDVSSVLGLLKGNTLLSIFRVGFGLALKLRWEAERWIKTSWFSARGLDYDFWGEYWGGILSGIMKKRPRFYEGSRQEGEEFRDFQWVSDLGDCLTVLRHLMVLDALLEQISRQYPVDENLIQSVELSFRPLIFNFWARNLLKLEPSFSGISLHDVRNLFSRLRSDQKRPPYTMGGLEDKFIQFFMSHTSRPDREATPALKETISLIWQEFSEEYQWVSIQDLSEKYAKFFLITPSP